MARSVSDVALLQSVMAGRHPSDHTSWGEHGADYLSHVQAGTPQSLRGVRIAYSPTLGGFPVAASIHANTEALVARLAEQGAIVEVVEPRWDTLSRVLDTIFSHFGTIMGRALSFSRSMENSKNCPHTPSCMWPRPPRLQGAEPSWIR